MHYIVERDIKYLMMLVHGKVHFQFTISVSSVRNFNKRINEIQAIMLLITLVYPHST